MLTRSVAMKRPIAKSRVSPGRNGKNSPHSTKTIRTLAQKNQGPNQSSSCWGSIQPMPSSMGCPNRTVFTPQRYPQAPDEVGGSPDRSPTVTDVPDVVHPEGPADGADDGSGDGSGDTERAPYDPMPHGPPEVGLGPWE